MFPMFVAYTAGISWSDRTSTLHPDGQPPADAPILIYIYSRRVSILIQFNIYIQYIYNYIARKWGDGVLVDPQTECNYSYLVIFKMSVNNIEPYPFGPNMPLKKININHGIR